MGKHLHLPLVLVCTLSTCCEDNEQTLPSQVIKILLKENEPGTR